MISASYILCFICLGVLNNLSDAAYCNDSPDPGERTNNFPILDQADMTFQRKTKNAVMYMAGPETARFPVVHLYGNPYEVGYAQGTIMKKEMNQFIYRLWGYLTEELVGELPGSNIPEAAKAKIVEMGVERALDWTAEQTAPFTSQAYYDEVRGLSDASGIPYDLLYRINMFPELTKAQCSFFGAWGSAVGKANHAYQLRALDFDTDGPFKEFPQLTVYHPSEGNAYAQVSWPGNVGTLTGFSQKQLAVSEIGVSFPDDSFGQGTDNTPPEIVKGQPWMFILRDILQYDDSLEAAKNRISSANRTCNLIIGLGDGKKGPDVAVNGVEFSGRVCNFYDDKTLLPANDTWHAQITDIVYNGMDWNCPNYDVVLHDQLQKYHGSLTEEETIHNILPTVQTGNLHIAVYDLTDSLLHVSFMRKAAAVETEPLYAYERQFTRLHMQDIFAEPNPNTSNN